MWDLSSLTRARIHISCITRWILNHWAVIVPITCLFKIVVQSLNHVWLCAAPWTVAHQVPLSSSVSWSLENCPDPAIIPVLIPCFSFLLSNPHHWPCMIAYIFAHIISFLPCQRITHTLCGQCPDVKGSRTPYLADRDSLSKERIYMTVVIRIYI